MPSIHVAWKRIEYVWHLLGHSGIHVDGFEHIIESLLDNKQHGMKAHRLQLPCANVYINVLPWALEFKFLAGSSIAQLVCEWAFSLLAIRCLRLPRFESCIQQKKTTCLLSIWISLACARASKLTTNMQMCISNVLPQYGFNSIGNVLELPSLALSHRYLFIGNLVSVLQLLLSLLWV